MQYQVISFTGDQVVDFIEEVVFVTLRGSIEVLVVGSLEVPIGLIIPLDFIEERQDFTGDQVADFIEEVVLEIAQEYTDTNFYFSI